MHIDGRGGRRLAGAVALGLLLALTTAARAESPVAVDGPHTVERPLDVVVLLVDDMDDFSCARTDDFLPRSARWLRDQGRCFENATVTDPVCCPSRAVLATGQVSHNNGVTTQEDADLLDVPSTIPGVLRSAGYTTYGTGKFFNGVKAQEYESGRRDSGFVRSDFWNGMKYYGYKLWSDELQRPVLPPDRVHTTVRTGDFAAAFLETAVTQEGHFYEYVGFKAPHLQNEKDNVGEQRFPEPTPRNARRPVPPLRWNPERDVSDKLSIFGDLRPERGYFDRLHAARVRALYDVDDQVARLMRLLDRSGRLDSTVVVLTSDNGFHLGSNGWMGKSVPYRDSLAVPLLIRYPAAFGSGVVDDREVGLVDIAPTLYDLMGVAVPHVMDGHSLLSGHARVGTFHEFTNERSRLVAKESGVAATRVPDWATYRIGDQSYVEYYGSDGTVLRREFYDDRAQQRNLLAPQHTDRRPPASVLARFQALLTAARTCAGTAEGGAANPCP